MATRQASKILGWAKQAAQAQAARCWFKSSSRNKIQNAASGADLKSDSPLEGVSPSRRSFFMTPLGIIELIKLSLKVWLAVNASKPFQRLHEIDADILRLSIGARESELLQIEALDRERRVLAKLVGSIHADIG